MKSVRGFAMIWYCMIQYCIITWYNILSCRIIKTQFVFFQLLNLEHKRDTLNSVWTMLTPLSPSSTIIKSQTFFIITYDISSLKFCIDNIVILLMMTVGQLHLRMTHSNFRKQWFEIPQMHDSSSKRCRNNLDGTRTDDGGRVVSFVDILYFA